MGFVPLSSSIPNGYRVKYITHIRLAKPPVCGSFGRKRVPRASIKELTYRRNHISSCVVTEIITNDKSYNNKYVQQRYSIINAHMSHRLCARN